MIPETPGVSGRQCTDSEPMPTTHLPFTSWTKRISRDEGDSLQSSPPTAGHSEVPQRTNGWARGKSPGRNVQPARAAAATALCALPAATIQRHSLPGHRHGYIASSSKKATGQHLCKALKQFCLLISFAQNYLLRKSSTQTFVFTKVFVISSVTIIKTMKHNHRRSTKCATVTGSIVLWILNGPYK